MVMWDIHETDNSELLAVHRESGSILRLRTATEANALAIAILQALQSGTYTPKIPSAYVDGEWLTMGEAVEFAHSVDPERFPYEPDKPYHQQALGQRIRKATSEGSIKTVPNPDDKRRVLLSRNDFMIWMRNARNPYTKGE
jgi:hypothetical protein